MFEQFFWMFLESEEGALITIPPPAKAAAAPAAGFGVPRDAGGVGFMLWGKMSAAGS